MQKLGGLEAPLHNAIQLFLTLAPTEFVAKLFQADPPVPPGLQVACCKQWDRLKVGQRDIDLLELCQPDIFIEGAGLQIAVEIKAKSESSLEQVLKYAALMLVRPPAPSAKARRKLVFVAPYEKFADFWRDREYADIKGLRQALRKVNDLKMDGKFRRFGVSLDQVKASLDQIEIAWRSVRDMRRDVSAELKRVSALEPLPAREVYRKLLSGFETELRHWQGGE
jgi:hypothetical protein